MKNLKIPIYFLMISIVLVTITTACSSGGGNDDDTGTSNNTTWDELVWDDGTADRTRNWAD